MKKEVVDVNNPKPGTMSEKKTNQDFNGRQPRPNSSADGRGTNEERTPEGSQTEEEEKIDLKEAKNIRSGEENVEEPIVDRKSTKSTDESITRQSNTSKEIKDVDKG